MAKSNKRHEVMRLIRNRILRGAYMGRLPGERALAAELRVDQKTVETAMAQLEVLGMVRRVHRRGTFVVLPEEAEGRISMLYVRFVYSGLQPRPATPNWGMRMASAFETAARQYGHSMVLEYNQDRERIVSEAIRHASIPTCLGTCMAIMPFDAGHLLRLATAPGPVVVMDWEFEDAIVPYVTFDNFGGGVLAAQHVITLGHRRIALVTTGSPAPPQVNRRRGVKHVAEGMGLPPVLEVPLDFESRGMVQSLFGGEGRPTAFICWGATDASHVMHLAAAAGLRVPRDLSVVSFTAMHPDDNAPEVTSVAFDLMAMGRQAFEVLIGEKHITHPGYAVVPGHLVEAGTTGLAPADA